MRCPSCNEERVITFTDTESYEYKGVAFTLENVELSRCDSCGFEFNTPEQGKEIDRLALDEQRAIDGLLTSNEIRGIRRKYALSQKEAAKLFGGGENSFSKYERSEVKQSQSMDKLLRIVDKSPGILTELRRLAGETISTNITSWERSVSVGTYEAFASVAVFCSGTMLTNVEEDDDNELSVDFSTFPALYDNFQTFKLRK